MSLKYSKLVVDNITTNFETFCWATYFCPILKCFIEYKMATTTAILNPILIKIDVSIAKYNSSVVWKFGDGLSKDVFLAIF